MKNGNRFSLVVGGTPPYTVHRSRQQMVRDVREGLTKSPKQLSPKYFYDERGSELFEEITQLPEYYLTRAERMLLERRISEIIAAVRPCSLVELGAGSATKTRIILDEMRSNGCAECYVPVDVSKEFLEAAAVQLRADYVDVQVMPLVSDITEPFALPPVASPTLVAFLGSTIGNFPREEAVRLLSHIAGEMGPSDRFLLGADLIKDPAIINRAYNDSSGVTAAFNLNMLARANRELGADFDLTQWRHRAVYNQEAHRIEMHLISEQPQTVRLGGREFHFDRDEKIITEFSYKHTIEGFSALAASAGFQLARVWTDPEKLFAVFHFTTL